MAKKADTSSGPHSMARQVAGLDSVLGQDDALDFLRTGLERGRLAHALLLNGPQGVGKHTTAVALAQALNCPVAPGQGCGECSTCARMVRRTHPDLVVVEPDGRWIKIDQVRALESRLESGPYEANTLVVVFDPADRMNAAAANALLKALEEPRRSVLFCLVTSAPHAILPTVRSRCQSVRFAPLSTPVLSSLLRRTASQQVAGMDETTIDRIVELAEGSLGRAVELAGDESFSELIQVVDRTMVAARAPFDPVSHFVFAAELAELGPELERLLSMLEFEVRSRTRRVILGNEGLAGDGTADSIDDPRVLTKWFAALQKAKSRFKSNANRKLLCETLLVDLTGAVRERGA